MRKFSTKMFIVVVSVAEAFFLVDGTVLAPLYEFKSEEVWVDKEKEKKRPNMLRGCSMTSKEYVVILIYASCLKL